jgi:hypothetical protein
MLGQGSEGVLNRLPRTTKIPRRNFRRLSTGAVVNKSQEATLGSLMFCKHVKQILVGANLDVHLSLNAEVKQFHNILIIRRILILNFSNQIYEVGTINIDDFVQAKPPSMSMTSNYPDF